MNVRRSLFRLAFGARLPRVDRSLQLRGLRAPLTIRRDRYSVPYINAQNDEDAWFGLGFCQAQDRAFQMELRLRTARGTLSEVFGERTLDMDRLTRRLGLWESAVRQLEVIDADIRSQAEAFGRGINAAFAIAPRAHEFVLTRSRPTPWQAADVLATGKLMSLLLLGNWDVELARLQILRLDGAQALRDLDPSYPPEQLVNQPPNALAGPAADRLSEDLARLEAFAGQGGGSNAWAVDGSRTVSGKPILANDPHLDPALPPHWYLTRLQTPEWSLAGASLIGSPAIAAGHNGFAAWGITAGLADTVDLSIEEVGPDGRSVRRGDAYVPCEVRREVIQVKGRTSVIEDVLVTDRGPVIGPAFEGDVGAISCRATWLEAMPVRGFLGAQKAYSFEAFRSEFDAWPLLSCNLVYADQAGVAWQLVGQTPRRRQGWGTLPLPASDPETAWHEGMIPLSEMPYVLNPPEGWVATANNKPVADDSEGPYLGVDWLDGYRYGRIAEALSQRQDWTVAATQRLQMDETSLPWREVRDAVLALTPSSPEARLALELLKTWDGVLALDSAAGAVCDLFLGEMWRRMAQARAPRSWQHAVGRGFTPLLSITTFAGGRSSTILRNLRAQPQGWFARGWPEEMADALRAVVADLTARFGADSTAWGWGRVRQLTLEHPLGVINAIAPIFNRGPIPWGGDGNTISQGGTSPLRPLGNPLTISSLRVVIEIGSWDEARYVLPGGQSGNPVSPHYDDMLDFWRSGDGLPIAWSAAAVDKACVTRLELRPQA